MQIVKILKRKDASAIIVAVALALIASSAVTAWSAQPAAWLSGTDTVQSGLRAGLWQPFVHLVVQLVVFELLIRVYTMAAEYIRKAK